jgi:Flp pilus assembly protein TadG
LFRKPVSSYAERGPLRILRCERGAGALEFALVGGLLVMLVIGAVEVGRAFQARNAMNHALAEAVRLVHLRPTTQASEVEAALVAALDSYDDLDLAVEVTEIVDTSFMRVSVQFPYRLSVPLLPERELTLRVETLAPMVSPTQT